MPIDRTYALADRYSLGLDAPAGPLYLTGTQALVRMLLAQAALDRAEGRDTAGFVSGYRGSPLGALDQEMWRAAGPMDAARIRFQPAINEDLGATAVLGTQKVESDPARRHQGVFALWYGKGPGVDRSGDALKHGNAYGASPNGGVLVVAGDDHGCVSSSMSHQSDQTFMAWGMPVVHPASIADYEAFGLWGWALSRASGCWVGFKAISETVEGAASIVPAPRPRFAMPEIDPGPAGLHWRWPDPPGPQVEQRLAYKLAAATAFARANPLDRETVAVDRPRLLIAAVGKAHGDLMEALRVGGVSADALAAAGVAVLCVGLVHPLSPRLADLAERAGEVLVIEEKGAVVETLLKQHLYNRPADSRPPVAGKTDVDGRPLLPGDIELRPHRVGPAIAPILARFGLDLAVPEAWRARPEAVPADLPKRTPYFCSGCPHNTSTRVPEGSRAQPGIGCHAMAMWMDRETAGSVQMGGEGVDWIGHSPFVDTPHVFQNVGDGTYFHSGHLALRQAVAAGTNVTYKILYNDAVAMTGGQPVDGTLTVPQIARLALSEGARRVVVVADDPEKYDPDAGIPETVAVRHRDALDAVQRELREIPGVTVLIYDQVCATEQRRRRKRARQAPTRRVVINDLVCEGCGDCQVKSNCLSVVPVETEFGRKRRIDQASCNTDLSCLKGFCPSFVTIEGFEDPPPAARGVGAEANAEARARAAALSAPDAAPGEAPFELLIAGVGGTGIVTAGALVAMAAHLEGRGVSMLNFMGFAQKGGPVLSHLRVARDRDALHQVRIDRGRADAVLVADLVVGASAEPLSVIDRERTRIVASPREIQTGAMLRDPDARIDTRSLEGLLSRRVADGAYRALDCQGLAERLLGDATQANILMLGFAWQLGLVPVSDEAMDRAIELNGVGIEANRTAFAWGRVAAADPAWVTRHLPVPDAEPPAETLEDIVARRVAFLTDYQDARYAERYRTRVETARRAAERAGDPSVAEAVARNLFKLMAYKDEYEVARLHTRTGFLDGLSARYGGKPRVTFHFAPPVLSKPGPGGEEPAKRAFGPWVVPVLRALAGLRRLRGTPFDPFGYLADRREERRLLAEYEAMLDAVLPRLEARNAATVRELAALPETVRGYGPVKARSIADAESRRAALLRRLETDGADTGTGHRANDDALALTG